jgi:hypothetical protein
MKGVVMPNFARAEITDTEGDLAAYKTFVRSLKVGQVVTLPLEEGETSRRVMRSLNAAATEQRVRLARLSSLPNAVKFRVMPGEKRVVNLSEEARQARAAKARATRQARRQAAQEAQA